MNERRILKQFCQNAYLNGIRELYESRNRKWHLLFWVCTLTIMIGSSFYFVAKVVSEYVSSPTVTTIATYPSSQLEMPEIMLCFNGGLNATALLAENFSKDLILVLSGALPLGTATFENLTAAKNELDSYMTVNNLSVDQLYEKFSYSCTDMVDYFYEAGVDRGFVNRACTVPSAYISPIYGRCMIYRNNSVQRWPGLSGGVRATLKFPQNSVAQLFPVESLQCDKTMSYVVSLEKRFDIQSERFMLIPANMKTEIVLNTKRYIRMPDGKTGCNRYLDNGNLCAGRCYADAVFLSCGCVPYKYYQPSYHKEKRICTPFDEYSCTTFLQYSIQCNKDCLPACDEWVFEATLSYGPGIANADGRNSSLVRSSVWIGYETLQYTEINEVYAFSIEDAIANVGAQIGLWLGCSLVTIVQGIYYLYMACFGPKNEDTKVDEIKAVENHGNIHVSDAFEKRY